MAKRMIVDPDHLSVRARKSVLSLLEAKRYSGVVSSHSWSTPDVVPRIYNLGGVITPYAGDSKTFVTKWRESAPKAKRGKYYFGFGYGADMNGFGAQGNARNGPNPVTYPFKSWDGKQTINQQKSGDRLYDINKDGVAHYGLYPDWIEDLRKQAGNGIVRDMARGSEAYLQMWERAEGVKNQACRSARGQFTAKGMGRQRLGAGAASVLQKAGQPARRQGRLFRWCVTGKGNRKARLAAVFDRKGRVALLASNALGHGTISPGRVRISRGAPARKLRGRARPIGRGLYVRKARGGKRFVYKVSKGRVRYVGVASQDRGEEPQDAAGVPAALRRQVSVLPWWGITPPEQDAFDLVVVAAAAPAAPAAAAVVVIAAVVVERVVVASAAAAAVAAAVVVEAVVTVAAAVVARAVVADAVGAVAAVVVEAVVAGAVVVHAAVAAQLAAGLDVVVARAPGTVLAAPPVLAPALSPLALGHRGRRRGRGLGRLGGRCGVGAVLGGGVDGRRGRGRVLATGGAGHRDGAHRTQGHQYGAQCKLARDAHVDLLHSGRRPQWPGAPKPSRSRG